jgi:hypothetical protein
MGNVIEFRRPEMPYSVSRLFVSNDVNAETHVRHLKFLGYTIFDVVPFHVDSGLLSNNLGNTDVLRS